MKVITSNNALDIALFRVTISNAKTITPAPKSQKPISEMLIRDRYFYAIANSLLLLNSSLQNSAVKRKSVANLSRKLYANLLLEIIV